MMFKGVNNYESLKLTLVLGVNFIYATRLFFLFNPWLNTLIKVQVLISGRSINEVQPKNCIKFRGISNLSSIERAT